MAGRRRDRGAHDRGGSGLAEGARTLGERGAGRHHVVDDEASTATHHPRPVPGHGQGATQVVRPSPGAESRLVGDPTTRHERPVTASKSRVRRRLTESEDAVDEPLERRLSPAATGCARRRCRDHEDRPLVPARGGQRDPHGIVEKRREKHRKVPTPLVLPRGDRRAQRSGIRTPCMHGRQSGGDGLGSDRLRARREPRGFQGPLAPTAPPGPRSTAGPALERQDEVEQVRTGQGPTRPVHTRPVHVRQVHKEAVTESHPSSPPDSQLPAESPGPALWTSCRVRRGVWTGAPLSVRAPRCPSPRRSRATWRRRAPTRPSPR